LNEPNKFVREYFIQTRKEIDTEKRERDQILNFAVLILGAIGFAIFQSETAQEFLQQPKALTVELPALVIITSLFWIRRKKLQQIADRWFVLHRLAERYFDKEDIEMMLEEIVLKKFLKRTYVRKDFFLNIALCLPIYGLLILQLLDGFHKDQLWRTIFIIIIVILHSIFSFFLLYIKLKNPFSQIEGD